MRISLKMALTIFVLASFVGRADIIYNVTFEDPPHVIGSGAVTGSGPDRPQLGGFGIAWVPEFGSQGARTDAPGTDTFMAFMPSLTYSTGIHAISFDWLQYTANASLTPDSAVTFGTLGFLDLTHVRNIVSLHDYSPSFPYVGSYSTGQVYSYSFLLNLDSSTYDFSIDGATVVSGVSFTVAPVLNTVTFSQPWSSSHAVDNFRWEIVPEPSTVVLVGLGLVGLCGRRILRTKGIG